MAYHPRAKRSTNRKRPVGLNSYEINLEEVSNKVRYETETEKLENQQKLMTKVPINIYIG